MDYAYRKERLNQNLNFDSHREALLIEAGPARDPNWRGGTGRSAAAYGNAHNPVHQTEYRVGQIDAWAVQRSKGKKGKGKGKRKACTWVDNHEQKAWYDRLDLAPAERPEGENLHGNARVANNASRWINDESQWTDYSDDRSRKSARLTWYNEPETPVPAPTPSSGSNATRWEQGLYYRDYARIEAAPSARLQEGPGAPRGTAGRRAREPLSESTEQQLSAIDWNQHFSGEAAPRGAPARQTFARDVREVKDEDHQPEGEPDWS